MSAPGGMSRRGAGAAATALLMLAGCASAPEQAAAGFIVVRHAEKAADGSRDPALSAAGQARAQALARRLQDARLVAVYATPYRRTQQTVQPTAASHALHVTTYDANLPASEFVAQLRRAHPAGGVLVAGHSNTAPQIASQLCGCDVAPLADDAYGDLYRIDFDQRGQARLSHESF